MSVQNHLLHLFENYIPVMSIAEKLLVFQPHNYLQEMRKRNFQTAVIATDQALLKFDEGDPCPTLITNDDLLSADTPLMQAFEALLLKRRFFIQNGKDVDHIVTRSDLDKIPMKLALFGLVSVLETKFRELVKKEVPDWEHNLSKERLSAARELFQLKTARNEEIDLLQCLQLADLGSIFSKKQRFKKFDPNLSRDQFDDMLRKLGKLRDALAHSQQILPFPWPEIQEIILFIRKVIDSKAASHKSGVSK